MHCLIYMKRGGKMEQETEKKSNRKIHIIFAIFTLVLSFEISFIDASAVSYEKTLTVEQFNKYIAEYPYYSKSYAKVNGAYNSTYYFSKTKIYYENNQIKTEDNTNFIRVQTRVYVDDETFKWNESVYQSGSNYISMSSFVHSNYDIYENGVLYYSSNPEDFPVPPVAISAVGLPEVVEVNSRVIIGGTICLMALMIFLVVLVRHLRKVSQGY